MVDNEEEAQDFLDRLDLDLEDFESIDTMRDSVNDIFNDFYDIDATDSQIDALFNAGDLSRVKFPSVGIRKFQYQAFGKTITRYALPFQRGSFGFEKALNLFKNL